MRARRTVNRLWTPSQLGASLQLWLNAKKGISLNSGDVSSWADLSGKNRNVSQATGGQQPAFSATGYNNRPAVVFTTANNDRLTTAADVINLATAFSIFFVFQLGTNTSNSGRIISYKGTGQTHDFADTTSFGIDRNSTNNEIMLFHNFVTICTQAVSLDTNYRVGFIYNGATVTPYLNGVAGTPGAMTDTLAAATISIGRNETDTAGLDGPFSELVIAGRVLTAAEIKLQDNYFLREWAA